MSTAGLEPARVSPHAPQTCAYTDSATSTWSFGYIYSIIKLFYVSRRMLTQGQPSRKMILNHFPAAECHIDKKIFYFQRQCYISINTDLFAS